MDRIDQLLAESETYAQKASRIARSLPSALPGQYNVLIIKMNQLFRLSDRALNKANAIASELEANTDEASVPSSGREATIQSSASSVGERKGQY